MLEIAESSVTDEDLRSIGHSPEEMVLFCSNQGKSCNRTDLISFRDTRYGTCVTYNSGRVNRNGVLTRKSELQESTITGPQYGGCLTLFITMLTILKKSTISL